MRSYFRRVGKWTFQPTDLTGGAWDETTQHVAPALGVLAHLVEEDAAARRGDDVVLSRLSYDILGTMPIEEVECTVGVLRPGRTIELVEATMSHAGRPAVRMRAWIQGPRDTSALAACGFPPLPAPEEMPEWDPTTVWPGEFIATARSRRLHDEPGRARCWIATDVPLLDSEQVSTLAGVAGLMDIANGLAVRADPGEVIFPNIDLTAHVFRSPEAGWLGFDTTVSFGPTGLGLTSSVLHDARGPFGTLAQTLTVRPTG